MKRLMLSVTAACVGCLCSFAASSDVVDGYLEYLYARMALADSLDYSKDFYVRNIESALKARQEMPWGKDVPEREFRNFVLPVRVNNEQLDDARQYFYDVLAPRVKGLPMSQAVLEINHWLHEKVNYRPSDSRTSSPLCTVRTSFGRCGEESTLGVSAMRAVGIPARQVYTPRWAHTDDNHAWVEVWVDGKWYFLGACEPEPILNLAWFNAPASRGMLMSANALGGYDGPEELLGQTRQAAKINVTANYAPVDTARVAVVDKWNRPVADAVVRFMLYNYAEFYPIAVKTASTDGRASLITGLGDLIVWATAPDGNSFGLAKYSVGRDGELVLALDKDAGYEGTFEMDIVPPRQSGSLPVATKEQVAENAGRWAVEDSIRGAYTATFYNDETALAYVRKHGLEDDAAGLLTLAYGNYRVIENFLASAKSGAVAVHFLRSLSEKDVRDITPEILADSYSDEIPQGCDTVAYVRNVMCPRVSDENLTPYRSYFRRVIPEHERNAYAAQPAKWIDWINANISVALSGEPVRLYVSPEKVFEHRRNISVASRDIFAVASLRSFGVQAYMNRVTQRPHYIDPADGSDVEMAFNDAKAGDLSGSIPQGSLLLGYEHTGRIADPAYYTHFTLSSISHGAPVLLNFADDATWNRDFSNGITVDAGQTMLVSGQRMANGSVLARASIFNVVAGEQNHQPLVIRQDTTAVQVLGNFNSENLYHDIALDSDKSILSTTGRGYYIIGLIRPNHEPSTHILNDISTYAGEIEAWGGKILLLFADDNAASTFNKSAFPKLPGNVVFGVDRDGVIAGEMAQFGTDSPLMLIADTFNRVVFISEGYTINFGRTILDTISKLE